MDKVDEMRSKVIVDAVLDCLGPLFDQHMKSMIIPPAKDNEEKRQMAREQLLLAYVDAARCFYASRVGKAEDAQRAYEDAKRRLSRMRDKLQCCH